jgi:hypothetical protein
MWKRGTGGYDRRAMGNGSAGQKTVRSVIIDDPRDAAALSGQGKEIMETRKTSLIYHLAP